MSENRDFVDVAVVGGGLAGLGVAAYLARAGQRVAILEKAATLGGRAATDDHGGFLMNRGPHALYLGSDGREVLRDLGVPTPGKIPPAAGSLVYRGGTLHELPANALSLIRTSLLGVAEKATFARLLTRLPAFDSEALSSVTIDDWLDREGLRGTVRELLCALFRLSTYGNAPAVMSAGTAVRQLQRAVAKNVLYVDGGWQTLVDGLRARAEAAGANVITSARVSALEGDRTAVTGVKLADGRVIAANDVVLTCDPLHATELLATVGAPVPASMRDVTPVRMATLDLGLKRLPRPRPTFVLGVDAPLYFSVHSAAARLVPEGAAMIHAAKYLGDVETDPDADRREIEALLDLAQPGWRSELVHAQWLPRMTVSERLDVARDGGWHGRPNVDGAGIASVHLAGDWVQGGSLLVDASLGSARAAAQAVQARTERKRQVA
jgi:phytoene dehydrogenase-like protein